MIKIVTKDGGVSLDLAPDAEFVIEYNNPMMEDDRIPVPFSTDIALLPSATNCKTLRYLPAFKLEPAVKQLAVSLIFDGIPFLTGTLSFNGIEDGHLNYTFAGKDIADDWGKKLYELEAMYYNTLDDGTKERNDKIFYPSLLNKNFTGYFEENDAIAFKDDFNNCFAPKTKRSYKYKNPYQGEFGPAVNLTAAISFCEIIPETVLMDQSLYSYVKNMAVIAPYKEPKYISSSGATGRVEITNKDFATMLPEMTVSEFVVEFLKMLCASIFQYGDGIVMYTFESMSALSPDDWTDKISDEFSSEVESGEGYVFGFDNSGEDSADITEYEAADTVAKALYVSDGNNSDLSPIVNLKTVHIQTTGDYISNQGSFLPCYYQGGGSNLKWFLVAAADILFQNNLKQMNVVEGKDSVENICGFNLVKCVPCILNKQVAYAAGDGAGTPSFAYAPVLDFPNKEAERGSDVYIGLMVNSQLTDSGRAMPGTVPDPALNSSGLPTAPDLSALADVTLTPDGWSEAVSLRPDWLYEHFHKSYAAWLAKDRQLLSCDVNLSVDDLLHFAMYRKVLIHGREFFVKKLSVTLRTGSKALECTADFISA